MIALNLLRYTVVLPLQEPTVATLRHRLARLDCWVIPTRACTSTVLPFVAELRWVRSSRTRYYHALNPQTCFARLRGNVTFNEGDDSFPLIERTQKDDE
jgi:hypothetical protein